MNKLKLARFLFVLALVLAVIFAVLLFIQDAKDNVLGTVGLWCGLISQLLLAGSVYAEIRKGHPF